MPLPGLYIHIPFCCVKCPYCDFYSVAANEEMMDAYTRQLCRLLTQLPQEFPGFSADSIYFGGGTPSLLGARRLGNILEAAAKAVSLPAGSEVTLEANPGAMPERFPESTVTPGMLRSLRASGFSRISFGLQSAEPRELAFLGRRHSAAEGLEAAQMAADAGFQDISLDLMLGLAGQTEETLSRSIAACAATPANHLSAYLLKVEENTLFYRREIWKECPDEEQQAQLYLHMVSELKSCGFAQYEISNFAKDGHIGRHNLKYWDSIDYLGIGPAAHSFLDGRRWSIPRDLRGFLSAGTLRETMVPEGNGGDAEEYLMLRLRLTQGVRAAELRQRHPEADWDDLCRKAKPYEKAGLIRLDPNPETGFLALTPSGFLVSNTLIARLL